MTTHNDRWTAQDLELYLDDELGNDRRAALTDALRKDPALRNRLASIAHADDELRTLFLESAGEEEAKPQRVAHRWASRWALVAAACLVVSVLASLLFRPQEETRRELVYNANAPAHREIVSRPAYESIRVVFSLPAKPPDEKGNNPVDTPGEGSQKIAKDVPAAANEDRAFRRRLKELLASGGVENAIQLLSTATDDQRNVAFAAIGNLLRSAEVAERMLDRLSPREQLAACQVWAQTPAFRPLIFARLRQLSAQPEYAEEVQTVLTSFEAEPTLRKWLRASQLRT